MTAAAALARVMAMPGAPWAAMGDAGVRLVDAVTGIPCSGRPDYAMAHPERYAINPADPAVETVLRRAVGGHAQVAYSDDGSCAIEWWPAADSDGWPVAVRAASPVEAWCALVERLGGWPGR